MSLLKRWGFGVDLTFNPGDTEIKMTRVGQAAVRLRQSFSSIREGFGGFASGLGQVAMVLAPLGLAFGAAVAKSSSMASTLEGQILTMRVLLGDAAKAQDLIARIRTEANSTPFETGDLIEGSKLLLRISGDSLDKNMELLKVLETMTALNPGTNIEQAAQALLDATGGGGFGRMTDSFGMAFKMEDFAKAGKPGGQAYADSVVAAVRDRMREMTKGGDIVGELGKSFGGRLSTLGDAFAGGFLTAGEKINERLGPMIVRITDRVNAMAPAFARAVDLFAAGFDRLMTMAGPVLDQLEAWWTGLGTDGQASIMLGVMALGAFSAVAIPIGGALAAIVTLVGGLVSALVALAPILEGAMGLLAPEILIPVAAALAAVALGAVAVFAAFRQEGEGPLAFLMRIGTAIREGFVVWLDKARIAGSALWDGFSSSFGGFGPILEALVPPLQRLWDRFGALTAYLGGDSVNVDAWRMFGTVLGVIGTFLVEKVAAGIDLVAAGLDILMSLFQPFQAVIATFVQGLVGLVSGSMSVPDALRTMARAILGIFSALIVGIYGAILGAIEILIRTLITQLAGIPGMDKVLASTGSLGADKLAELRQSLSDRVSDSIAGIDTSGAAKAAAGSKAPTVTVNQGDTVVKSETTLKVNGKDLAKATGETAVKAGQRQGRDLPADTRGRVLRGNGTVTGLAPAEVL